MGMFKTPAHRLRSFRAIGAFVAATAILAVFLRSSLDPFGRLIAGAMFAGCVFLAAYNLWQMRTTASEQAEPSNALSTQASASRQAQFYRSLLWIVLIAFPVIAASIAVDLHQLDFGASHQVVIPAPIVSVYEQFGFLPAMLVVPSLGIVCCIALLIRIRLVNSLAERA